MSFERDSKFVSKNIKLLNSLKFFKSIKQSKKREKKTHRLSKRDATQAKKINSTRYNKLELGSHKLLEKDEIIRDKNNMSCLIKKFNDYELRSLNYYTNTNTNIIVIEIIHYYIVST